MKRLLLFLSLCFICTAAIAHTINWYVDGNVYHTTTCESGENVTPPTAPEKYGYTFQGWETKFTRIEYLQGSTTSYIDTQYTANTTTSIKTRIQFETVTNGKSFVFGGGSGGMELYPWDNKLEFNYNNRIYWGTNVKNNDILELSWNKNIIEYTINNSDSYFIDTADVYFKDYAPLYLYTLYRANTPSNIKIYYFQIYDNDVLVRDFIPVLDIEGTPCMYDKVERKFYYNAGAGDFIAGPLIGE